jgi:hypothetical protein
MEPVPVLPLERDGTLPPVALLLRWLASLPADQDVVEVVDLPPFVGCLPGLLRLGGIPRLDVHQRLPVPSFSWEGLGGGRVLVNGPAAEGAMLPLHHGALGSGATVTGEAGGELTALVELARLADAQAVLGQGSGAAWDQLLAIARAREAPRLPPLLSRGPLADDAFGAWNPLPIARRGVVSLAAPAGRAPWALLHGASGAAHPVQVVEGPVGRELLVELPLGALAAQRLAARSEPVPGPAWEVGVDALDNGLVRAELDVRGQIERLCFAGRFVELTAPLVRPLLDGLPAGERPAEIRVLEDGPVRARVAVSRETPQGMLHVTYTLHAHEALLRVAVAWDGPADARLAIDHPTALRHHDARLAGELAAERRRQTPVLLDGPAEAVRGCRWAVLDDGHGGGLALLAQQRPLAVQAIAGHLRLPCAGQLAYALADPGVCDVAHAALACAVPLRAYQGDADLPPALRLAGGAGTCPLWIRRAGPATELAVVEQLARRSRLWLFPAVRPTEAWRSDARGKRLGKLPLTPEGDGVQVDLHPGELALIHWL